MRSDDGPRSTRQVAAMPRRVQDILATTASGRRTGKTLSSPRTKPPNPLLFHRDEYYPSSANLTRYRYCSFQLCGTCSSSFSRWVTYQPARHQPVGSALGRNSHSEDCLSDMASVRRRRPRSIHLECPRSSWCLEIIYRIRGWGVEQYFRGRNVLVGFSWMRLPCRTRRRKGQGRTC